MRYSDAVMDWLAEIGFTHCFFVAGGNIMHLLDSARTRMKCVPFIHEGAAGIAAEYFNEVQDRTRAFALVTAGPGLTNIITALAGAHLESRELLVLGGQVKSSDLAEKSLRQRGIQEIDGVAAATPFCKQAVQVREPWERGALLSVIEDGHRGRKGPVLIEVCLDAQGAAMTEDLVSGLQNGAKNYVEPATLADDVDTVVRMLAQSRRPVLLLGGGLSRRAATALNGHLNMLGVPIATTWNAADRIDEGHHLYFGRPNTWGMRWSNILIQQADLIVAVGSRLGLQQTGFNWQGFAPLARVIHVDIDRAELTKGHPKVDVRIEADAARFLTALVSSAAQSADLKEPRAAWAEWSAFGREVRELLPLADPRNKTASGFVDPYVFVQRLGRICDASDVIIPCSSGGAFTVTMQAFPQRDGQILVSNKGLASMGYGLSGAIGAALARPESRVVLIEGDGGFAQNLQEVGTVFAQQLNLKMFIFDNDGYASIRMTQRRYFSEKYIGCDISTGLGLPDWPQLFAAYGVPVVRINPLDLFDDEVMNLFMTRGPAAFIVPIDPEQTYLPKIDSRVTEQGSMESSPLHLMSPPLDEVSAARVLPHLRGGEGSS